MIEQTETEFGCDIIATRNLPMFEQDPEDLNKLFADCMPLLFRAAEHLLHNHHDSEDALQDGLLLALRHLHQFKGESKFSTWLYSIVQNSARLQLRKQHSRRLVPIEEFDPDNGSPKSKPELNIDASANPEREYAQAEQSFLLAETLKELPASYQSIIRLCDLEGFSGKEAALQIGLSASALKARHHRARQAIRESLGPHFDRKKRTLSFSRM